MSNHDETSNEPYPSPTGPPPPPPPPPAPAPWQGNLPPPPPDVPPQSYQPYAPYAPYPASRYDPLATASLVSSIVGLAFCGILLGPAGLVMGLVSRRRIAKDPSLTGGGVALAGAIVGAVTTVLSVLAAVLAGSGAFPFGQY